MRSGPTRRRLGSVFAVASVVVTAGCGWGGDIGTGSKTDSEPDPERAADGPELADHVADRVPVTVDRVIDGDSIELTLRGSDVELRLEGYNAPELYTGNADGSDSRSCNGAAAQAALDGLLESAQAVELVERGNDRFGRTLGDVVIDGDSIVDRLIGGGYGLATGDDVGRRAAMVDAASAGLGVWGAGCGLPASEDLAIGAVQVDAPGNDRYNLTEEYVEVANTGSEPIDLDGWALRDDTTGHRFALPGTLSAGERLIVITGAAQPGVDRDGVHFLGEPFPVWSNGWETVILVDPDGVFADWRFVAEGEVVVQ